MIESDNVRDGALNGFFSCGSTNMIEGSRASNLDALGVGWEERQLQFCFLGRGDMFLTIFINCLVLKL